MESSKSTTHRGIPLSALFLLLTVCGMFAGLIAVGVRHRPPYVEGPDVSGVIFGVVLPLLTIVAGIAVGGALRSFGWIGVAIGGLAGAVVGATQAVVSLTSTSAVPELLVILMAGSVVVVLFGVVGRAQAKS
ncbi:MAG: hypothetical protein RIC55_19060 [Pirellulaceae bacterium]